ncbi:MAG: hypothetical protein GQ558_01335, partial [Thermoplasmata archaeon]|nr:hypothetical protein [Thermoplasmata archaeon]
MADKKSKGGGGAKKAASKKKGKDEDKEDSLLVERRDDGIIIITINRPERRNALDRHTLAVGRTLIRDIHYDSSARVLIVTGAGDKAFCAGADLKEREHMTMVEVRQYIRYIRDTFTEMESLPIPVIAAINGV